MLPLSIKMEWITRGGGVLGKLTSFGNKSPENYKCASRKKKMTEKHAKQYFFNV